MTKHKNLKEEHERIVMPLKEKECQVNPYLYVWIIFLSILMVGVVINIFYQSNQINKLEISVDKLTDKINEFDNKIICETKENIESMKVNRYTFLFQYSLDKEIICESPAEVFKYDNLGFQSIYFNTEGFSTCLIKTTTEVCRLKNDN